MPLYEYECSACGRFEIIQKFSDAALQACPTCGREVQKLLSAPAIQFKGAGWYVTDYARKGSKGSEPSSSGEGKAESKDGSSAPDTGASKPAGGSPAK